MSFSSELVDKLAALPYAKGKIENAPYRKETAKYATIMGTLTGLDGDYAYRKTMGIDRQADIVIPTLDFLSSNPSPSQEELTAFVSTLPGFDGKHVSSPRTPRERKSSPVEIVQKTVPFVTLGNLQETIKTLQEKKQKLTAQQEEMEAKKQEAISKGDNKDIIAACTAAQENKEALEAVEKEIASTQEKETQAKEAVANYSMEDADADEKDLQDEIANLEERKAALDLEIAAKKNAQRLIQEWKKNQPAPEK